MVKKNVDFDFLFQLHRVLPEQGQHKHILVTEKKLVSTFCSLVCFQCFTIFSNNSESRGNKIQHFVV